MLNLFRRTAATTGVVLGVVGLGVTATPTAGAAMAIHSVRPASAQEPPPTCNPNLIYTKRSGSSVKVVVYSSVVRTYFTGNGLMIAGYGSTTGKYSVNSYSDHSFTLNTGSKRVGIDFDLTDVDNTYTYCSIYLMNQ